MKNSLRNFMARETASTGGVKPELKISPAMRLVLDNIANGHDPFCYVRGRAQSGGAERTRMTLTKRGLVTKDMELTDAGRLALELAAK